MDEIDRKILRLMQAQPELTAAEVAAQVGLSHTPCWRRIKKMETDGVFERRVVVADPALLGLGVTVFAQLRLRQHDEDTLEALEKAALEHPEIVECFSMSGDSDYLFRVIARSIEDYERFLKKTLLHLPGVVGVNSSFALKTIKLTTDLPV